MAMQKRAVDYFLSLSRRSADLWFVGLFLLLFILRVAVLLSASTALSPDEAYYWTWSRALDIGYYSKGPVVALLIAASRRFFGDTAFAVRLPALICASASSLIFYAVLRRIYTPRLSLLAWLALNSMPIFCASAVLMTTDAPLLLCWLIAVFTALYGIQEKRPGFFIPCFAVIGVGALCKFTALLLVPSILLFLALTPNCRRYLLAPHLFIGLFFFAVSLLPVAFWNYEHHWTNFLHNVSHLQGGKTAFAPIYFAEMAAGQAGLVGPLIFAGIIASIIRGAKSWRAGDCPSGFLFSTAFPLIVLCVLVSLFRPVYANWPAPIYLSGLVLAVHLASSGGLDSERFKNLLIPAIVLSAVMAVLAHGLLFGATFGLPIKHLPSKKVIGWQRLAADVEDLKRTLEDREHTQLVLVAENYDVASELAFYMPSRPKLFVGNFNDRRMNQYDVWGGWEQTTGRTLLLLTQNADLPGAFRTHCSSISAVDIPLKVEFKGQLVRQLMPQLCYNYDGMPPQAPNKP